MIFYFTGTGNSYDAARQLAGDDKLVNIAECVAKKEYSFELGKEETVGIVFPVYFGGIPSIIQYFIKKLTFDRKPAYLYSVLTCGGDGFGAECMLVKELEKQGLDVDAVVTIVMPDNYILMYEPATDEERAKALEKSKVTLAELKEKLDAREHIDPKAGLVARAATTLMYPAYVHGRKTKKFWSDEGCTGCGLCEKRCPEGAIRLINKKPEWIKERCVQCLACLRCEHVQYGKITAARKRYTNPEWK